MLLSSGCINEDEWDRHKSDGHKAANTEAMFKDFEISIQHIIQNKKVDFEQINDLTDLLEWFLKYDPILKPSWNNMGYPIDWTRGKIHDYWDEPIIYQCQGQDICLISYGPNKTDDGGDGDDIVYRFVVKSVKKPEGISIAGKDGCQLK